MRACPALYSRVHVGVPVITYLCFLAGTDLCSTGVRETAVQVEAAHVTNLD